MRSVYVIILLFWAHSAFGIELVFGPEFALSNDEMLSCQKYKPVGMSVKEDRNLFCRNEVIEKKYQELYELWRSKYSSFRINEQNLINEDRWEFVTPDNVKFWLGVDPAILEIGTSPMTLQEFKTHKDQIQKMIFDDTKSIGLEPQLFAGGGHINIGLEQFHNKRLLLLNFLIDFYNHPELSMGVFGYDTNNAINLRQALYNIQKLYMDFQHLARVRDRSYYAFLLKLETRLTPAIADPFFKYWSAQRPSANLEAYRGGNVAIQLRNNTEKMSGYRIEIRAVRPQASADQWIRMIELLQARINYLEQFDELLPIKKKPLRIQHKGPLKNLLWNPPVDEQQALENFHKYVTESGLDWKDHQDYLWPNWKTEGGALDQFNDKLEENCNSLLQ